MNIATHRLTLVAALALLTGSALGLPTDDLPGLHRGDSPPVQVFRTGEGEAVSADALKGSALVIVYLAAEQRASESAAVDARAVVSKVAKAGAAVKLVYATGDTTLTPYFARVSKAHGLEDVLLVMDPGREFASKLGLRETPVTMILDERGALAHAITGHDAGYAPGLEARLAHTLGKLNDEGLAKALGAGSAAATPESRAAACRVSARHLRERGLLDEARVELDRAVALAPSNAEIRLDIADLELERGRTDEAEGALRALSPADNGSRRANVLWGIAHLRQGRLDEAEKALTEALALNPDPARAHYYLGRVYEQKGQAAKALEHYRAAAERLLGEGARSK